jgi:hypothetical protein
MARKTFGETLQGKPAEIISFALNQKVYLKLVGDYVDNVEEWQEIWPVVETDDGNIIRRRFVGDGSNTQPLIAAKKLANVPKKEERNWNLRTHRAVLVIVGTPHRKTVDGKKKLKIIWDKSVKIWQFGVKAMRKLQGIRDNEELREEAEERGYNNFDSNLEVYAITVEKVPTGGDTRTNVEYDINASKRVQVDKEDLEDYEEVEKKLQQYSSPSSAGEVQAFIDQFITGTDSDSGDEADSTDDEDEPKKKKKRDDDEDDDELKKKKRKSDDDDDDEDDDEPKKKKKSSDDDDTPIEIEDVDVDDDDEPPKKKKKKVDDDEDDD